MELTAGMPIALYQTLYWNPFLNPQELSRTALFLGLLGAGKAGDGNRRKRTKFVAG